MAETFGGFYQDNPSYDYTEDPNLVNPKEYMPFDTYDYEDRDYDREKMYNRAIMNAYRGLEDREHGQNVDFMTTRGNPYYANTAEEDFNYPMFGDYFGSVMPEKDMPGYYEGESVEPKHKFFGKLGGLLRYANRTIPDRKMNIPSIEDDMYEYQGEGGPTGGSEYFNMGGNYEPPEGY